MTKTRGNRGSSGQRVADALRTAILAGEYAPGTRIRQDRIAADLDASRAPVREGLRILEAEGLITVVANTGAWVSALTLAECEELYQIRERLEPLLLRQNMPVLTSADVDHFNKLAHAMEQASDADEFLELDRSFHLGMYERQATLILHATTVQLWNRTHHYRRAFTRMFRSSGDVYVHYDHHLLVDALRRDDADEAERVLAAHIRRTRHSLAPHPELFTTEQG